MNLRHAILAIGILCLSKSIHSQGIDFNTSLSFTQLKDKAAKENKLIFLDLWTTSCAPCIEMNRYVYIDKELGDFFNNSFVSAKIQMDEKDYDSEQIKSLRAEGKNLCKAFDIYLYPYYLFLTPEGKVVHQDLGYKDIRDMFELADIALHPEKQYVAKINLYKQRKLPFSDFPSLIEMAELNGDHKLSFEIGRHYFDQYLNKLSKVQLAQTKNVHFVFYHTHLLKTMDSFFKLIYKQPLALDSIIGPGAAASIIAGIVTKEEINPFVRSNGNWVAVSPDWNKIRSTISKKYDSSLADKLILDAEIEFVHANKNWQKFSELYDVRLSMNPILESQTLGVFGGRLDGINSAAWDVFEGSTDTTVLLRALKWSKLTVDLGEQTGIYHFILDTYANLLHKLGRTQEAIIYEEKAIKAEVEAYNRPLNDDNWKLKAIDLMKKGKKTW